MSLLSTVGDELLAAMLVYGYPILALVLVIGAIGVPVPASLLATVAGTLIAEGDLDPIPTVLIALASCLLGDVVGYAIGRLGGRELARRHGRWLGVGATRLVQVEALFQRWAGPTLLLSRLLLAIVGSAINLLAGASRLSLPVFVGYALAGRLVWVSVFVGLGYAFAGSAEAAAELASSLSGLVGIAGLAVLLAVATRPGGLPMPTYRTRARDSLADR